MSNLSLKLGINISEQVANLDYASDETIYFLRASVIFSDVLLLIVSYKLSQFLYCSKDDSTRSSNGTSSNYNKALACFAAVSLNAGLLMVDHIHFQYNGILLSLLLLSVYCCATRRYRAAALSFSTLVLMKHLYVLLAPVLAVFLLRHFCASNNVKDEIQRYYCIAL